MPWDKHERRKSGRSRQERLTVGLRLLGHDREIFKLKSEKRTLEFRWETFNTFNHTQFSAVGTAANFAADGTQTNTTFGKVTAARDGRKMMFGLKFAF